MADGLGFGNLPPNFLRDFAYLQQLVGELQRRQLPDIPQAGAFTTSTYEWLLHELDGLTSEGPVGDDVFYTGTASWTHQSGSALMDLSTPTSPRFGSDGDYSITYFSSAGSEDTPGGVISLITLQTPDTPDIPDLSTFNFLFFLAGALGPLGLAGQAPTQILPPFPFANAARITANYLTQVESEDPIDVRNRLLIVKTK